MAVPIWRLSRRAPANIDNFGFRPIPLGVFRGKRKKREEKKDIMRELCKFMENYLNLFLQFKSPFPSVYSLPCQALVPELQSCAVQFFPLSTP